MESGDRKVVSKEREKQETGISRPCSEVSRLVYEDKDKLSSIIRCVTSGRSDTEELIN